MGKRCDSFKLAGLPIYGVGNSKETSGMIGLEEEEDGQPYSVRYGYLT